MKWWIHEPQILGSHCPYNLDLEYLYKQDFRVIISLLNEKEQRPFYDPKLITDMGYSRYNIPISDWEAPTIPQIEQFLDIVQNSNGQGKIIVHCIAGYGRTGTMGAAYWISKGLSAEDAIEKVRMNRPGAVQSDRQMIILYQFEISNRLE